MFVLNHQYDIIYMVKNWWFYMDALFTMFKNVMIFVALALPGYILVKAKLLKASDSGVLSKLLSYVGLPFLILSSTLGVNLKGDFLLIAIICVVSCILLTLLIVFISILLTNKINDIKKKRMMQVAMSFSNNGFLGIPLAIAVFGTTHLIVSIIVVLNIINNIFIYTLGVYIISGDKKNISIKKAIFNPVLISFILGLIFNVLGVCNHVPEIITFSDHLKNIVTPISMIILGIKLADIPIVSLFTSKSCYFVSVIKLVLLPILSVGFGFIVKIIFGFSTDIIMAFFIAFAMPTAGLATVFSDQYNGDTRHSVIYILGTTLFSIITIPLLYFALNAIL